MGERYCALGLGLIFTLIGVAGFIPSLLSLPSTGSAAVAINGPSWYSLGYGYLFGLFPTNFIHNIVHCLVGVSGIAAYTDARFARIYCRIFAYAYALLAILGLLPFGKTLFGLMPIFGNNVWFNAITAAVAAYFGFIKPTAQTGDVAVPPKS
ncbi:DUF4383 domain-containing protein [Pleurocapsales cyanobacterium LEGE 06147]|nr:DUF4383 domain-containing protein [Pleurocapsales cyanobacterium LEGE 06147]